MRNRDKLTSNRHEMAPVASCSTGSSRPSSPVNALRSASPIFIPKRPFTLKEMGSDRSKFHCFFPWSYFLCGTLIQLSGRVVTGAEDGSGCVGFRDEMTFESKCVG